MPVTTPAPTSTRYWGDVEMYPDSDGIPMANNETHLFWINFIASVLQLHFRDTNRMAAVFTDLFWYAVQGKPEERVAPDVMIVLDKQNGSRGSYKVWEEGCVAPHVVFEILTHSNTGSEMMEKLRFFDRYGAQEFYVYDSDRKTLMGWARRNGHLVNQPLEPGWISPLLQAGIKMDSFGGLRFYDSAGRTLEDIMGRLARWSAEDAAERASEEMERATNERLIAQLRALGVEPDTGA